MFLYALYCSAVIWRKLPIFTVSGVLTRDPVTIQVCSVPLWCVKLCSFMEKVAHFDSFRCINAEFCHQTDVGRCVMLCTFVQLYGEGYPFWRFHLYSPVILSPYRYAAFRYAVYCCVVIWGSLSILTVSVVLILSLVTIQMCNFA